MKYVSPMFLLHLFLLSNLITLTSAFSVLFKTNILTNGSSKVFQFPPQPFKLTKTGDKLTSSGFKSIKGYTWLIT